MSRVRIVVPWAERSLLRKIVIGAVAVGIAVGVPLGLTDAYLSVRNEISAERGAAEAMALGLSTGVEARLRAGEDPVEVIADFPSTAEDQPVMRVDLVDETGVLAASTAQPPGSTLGLPAAQSSFLVYAGELNSAHRVSRPSFTDFFLGRKHFAHETIVPLVESDGVPLGTLRVVVGADGLRPAVVKGTLGHMALIGLAGAIGLSLIGVVLYPLLYVPITKLDQTARRISEGDRSLRMPVTSDDEIGRLALSINEMTEAIVNYRGMANTDVLTGLYNHRFAQAKLQELLEGRSEDASLALLMMDLDGFKRFNDDYGHVTGDEALKEVSSALRASCGSADIVCRYGGDEFMVLMPGRAETDARLVAQAIVDELDSRRLVTESGAELRLTGSIGIAVCPAEATDQHSLIALADAAMYQSKRRGGRSVRTADIAQQAFLATQATRFAELERLVDEVDEVDGKTRHQSRTAAGVALELAQAAGLSDDASRSLRIAGLLHDVGKSELPPDLLDPSRSLTADEEMALHEHVLIGERLIEAMPRLDEVLQGVANHHERFDGSGYPRGLAGQEIPILGRIMAIAVAYAELRGGGAHEGLSPEQALAKIEAASGSLYDPELVEHLAATIRARGPAAA